MSTHDVHIMLDLETLSEKANAALVSIAAIVFNPFGDDTEEFSSWIKNPEARENLSSKKYFYSSIKPHPEGHISSSTILDFWFKVSEEARNAITGALSTEEEVLKNFSIFISSLKGKDVVVKLWSKGGMDFAWLSHAFSRNNLPIPWNFRSERDLRTLQELARDLTGKSIKNPKFEYVAHDSLCDCAVQIYTAQECFRMLNGRTN